MAKGKAAPAKKSTPSKKKPAPAVGCVADDKKWQAQDDLRTIQRAKEIQQNAARMSAAQREANAQMAALKSIAK